MAYTRFSNGFDITSNSAVDKRLSLTKAQMLTAEDDFNLPDVYFCICPDDGKLYLFNVNNTPSNATGKFRQIDETLNSSIINAVNGATTATSIYAATGSGTSGQYLKSNGVNAAPTWSDISIDDGEIS